MSATTLNPEDLAAAARAALEQTVDTKVDAVRSLVETSVNAEEAERRARAARSEFESAWSKALSTGWTDKQLRDLGLVGPGQRRPRAPRKPRSADASPASADADE